MPELRFVGANWARGSAAGTVNRLRRFPNNRFVGHRDQMLVYDCDDERQFALISTSAAESSLDLTNRLQAFSPDSEAEAANRGFRPVTYWEARE